MKPRARPRHDCGLLPPPKGEGWGEGLQTIERSEPPHPHPLPVGERESRRAVVGARASHTRWVTLAAVFLFPIPCPAAAQSSVETFYKDQRVRMLVGYGVGTGNDLYLRLLARHIGKYIPGKPTMVPENMPGAGGIVMFNHLYNVAARDGTVLAHPSRSLVTEPLYGNQQARYDALKFGWLGSINRDVATCITWGKSGVASIEDARRREVAVGSTGASAESNYFPKLLNAVLGTRFKTVLGYPDSGAVGIAMERGELDGYCSFTWAAIKSARPNWLTNKQINVILQLSMAKHPELPDVPLVADLARDEASRQIFTLAFGAQKMGRPVATTPGVPPERLAALRQAFDDTMRDRDFQDDAKRNGLEAEGPITGAEVDDVLRDIYATPKTIVQRYEAIRNER
jgi:tripartite-type tricarboxylate transporter receptor subunit TctC